MQDRPDHLHRHPDRGGTKLDRQPGHLRIPNARIQVRMMQNYSLKRPNQRLFFQKRYIYKYILRKCFGYKEERTASSRTMRV